MKIFISGPISGMPDYNRAAFIAVQRALEAAGHAVMNPVMLHGARPDAFSHADYIRVCLAMIDICDALLMLPDWQGSVGATTEFAYAMRQRKPAYTRLGDLTGA